MKNYIDQLMQLTGGKSSGGSRARRGKGKNKYNAQKTGGYDSKKEYRRACLLKALLRSGEISDLREQVSYELIPAQRDKDGNLLERNCCYVADFVYTDNATGRTVVEDTKGFRTPDYSIKRKLMLYVHGISVVER